MQSVSAQYVMDRTTLCKTLLGLQNVPTGTATRVRGGPFLEVRMGSCCMQCMLLVVSLRGVYEQPLKK